MVRAVAGEVRAVRDAVARLHTVVIETDNLTPLANVNTPEEWAEWIAAARPE
jgi:molybdopterin-guanine dinucleotide biosynthesis protein A